MGRDRNQRNSANHADDPGGELRHPHHYPVSYTHLLYEAAHPGIVLTYNFDSSGTLKTQIQEGADCDLFISAGQKQMDQLDINADASVNTERCV